MRSEDVGEVCRISMLLTKVSGEIEVRIATRTTTKTEIDMIVMGIETEADVETWIGPTTTPATRIEGSREKGTTDAATDIEKTTPAV